MRAEIGGTAGPFEKTLTLDYNGKCIMEIKEINLDQVLSILPVRPEDSHKGTFGRLLNISGSSRYRGAAVLSCLGALRSGTGFCVLASVADVCDAAASHLPEIILCPLSACNKGYIEPEESFAYLKEEISHSSAVLFGCGLGNGQHTVDLLEYLLKNADCPVIIDADGLNALSKNMHLLHNTHVRIILTPHQGEMARLCGVNTDDIARDREGFAARFAEKNGVTLVLKGHGTLIADKDGKLLINPTGGPGLAKGGSGDVLAGIISAFAAQGIAPFDACVCGVYLHGLAADRTAARRGQYSMLPSEITTDLAEILAENGR